MNNRAAIRFLPACMAGLLAGWLVSLGLSHSTAEKTVRPVPVLPAPAESADAAWRAMLASRAASATARHAEDARARILAATPGHSPVRSEILKGDLLLSLPVEELLALLENPAGLNNREIGIVMDRLVEVDSALVFAAALRLQRERGLDCARTVCGGWARKDPEAGLKAIAGLPQGMVRSNWAWAMLENWASVAPAIAAKHLQELAALDSSRGENTLTQMGAELLDRWVHSDLPAAQKWVAGLSDAALRDKLEVSLIKKQAETDPAGAVAAAFQRRDVSGMEREIVEMWSHFYHKDAAAALQSLGQLPEKHPLWQQADQMAFAIFLNHRDPKLGEKLPEIAAQLPDGPRRDKFLEGLVSAGASNDVPFALKVLPLMNEGRERDQAISGLTEMWMRKDPVKTSEWLATLPADSDSRNSGVARFAEVLAPDDPERAAVWAATLPDSCWRKEGVMKTVLEKWRAKDPAAAEAWAGGK